MTNDAQPSQPFVSVIVPVYNDERRIQLCIEALLAQTYPRDRYEILIVDNGSTDMTRTVIASYPVTLLIEDQVQSSYAARNKGLQHARGDVIALTNSDCIPVPAWITEGVHALKVYAADMVGGNVRFFYSPRPTGAEIYNSLAHLKTEQYVRELNGAVTANLFVWKSVFDALGVFPSTMKSGGDMYWTRQATASGRTLIYAPLAEVAHPTRRLGALLKRQFRIGVGLNDLRAKERAKGSRPHQGQPGGHAKGGGILRKIYSNLKGLMPDSASSIRRSIQRDKLEVTFIQFWRIWAAAWMARMATTLGSLSRFVGRRIAGEPGRVLGRRGSGDAS